MVGERKNREQYRWALWALLILALLGYGCGTTDPGAGGDDGATDTRTARLTAISEAIDALWTAVATQESGLVAASHSAAWMEALDGLGFALVGDSSGDGVLVAGDNPVDVATVIPTPAPTVSVAPPQAPAPPPFVGQGQLTENGARAALAATGWPVALHNEAVAVFCGIGNVRFPSGESNCSPGAVGDGGRSLGFAQLNAATWAPYCGVTADALLDLHTNLACAYQVYLYDIGRGYAPWTQWSVKPW